MEVHGFIRRKQAVHPIAQLQSHLWTFEGRNDITNQRYSSSKSSYTTKSSLVHAHAIHYLLPFGDRVLRIARTNLKSSHSPSARPWLP
uniref:Uncharacterized protein n=1 Tax=Physcomitrium patens TaxID=3218 RepID=A0A2K1KAU5_PHYPA|nr:hypothetical protein PHYPA_010075 [Physcomitrium patens]